MHVQRARWSSPESLPAGPERSIRPRCYACGTIRFPTPQSFTVDTARTALPFLTLVTLGCAPVDIVVSLVEANRSVYPSRVLHLRTRPEKCSGDVTASEAAHLLRGSAG